LTLSPVLLAENDGEALPLCMRLSEKSCLAARSGSDRIRVASIGVVGIHAATGDLRPLQVANHNGLDNLLVANG
jgi:hypothetical protein